MNLKLVFAVVSKDTAGFFIQTLKTEAQAKEYMEAMKSVDVVYAKEKKKTK